MRGLAAALALVLAASLGCAARRYVAGPEEARVNNDLDWRIESPPTLAPATPPMREPKRTR